MSEMIKLTQIAKVFDKKNDEIVILDDINFSVNEREFLCIMGPTGCGKSTLLKIMGGIEKPTVGTISLAGEEFKNGIPREKLRKFGFVFQNHNLLEWRTVRKNLMVSLELFKLKGNNWNDRIDNMLELVGLQDYKNIYPHELSGGMKQRVGIARALVHDPDIVLMDQPFGALDAITRNMLAYESLKIWKQTQKTMVMVTNSVEEALLVSQRILVMDAQGTIVEEMINDIPVEVRDENITHNRIFNELRANLNETIHNLQFGKEAE